MKKTVIILGCLALLAAGCNKVQTVEDETELKFDITVNYANDTRSVKRDWVVGDKIYLVFDVSFQDKVGSYATNHGYVTMTYNGHNFDAPVASNSNFLKALQASPSGKLAALYISGGQTPQFEYVEKSGTRYLEVKNSDSLYGYFLRAHEVPYTIANKTLTATLNLTLDVGDRYPVHLFLPSIPQNKAANYTFACPYFNWEYLTDFNALPGTYGPFAGIWGKPYGEPLHGSYYDGGLEFVLFLSGLDQGNPRDYIFVVIDNNGTPDNLTDDVYRKFTKTGVTLYGKEAIKLPPLTDTDKWTVFDKQDMWFYFNGFSGHVYF